MTTVYGIKNCDTIKKTLRWLTDNQIEYTFHDYRKDGIDPTWLDEVLTQVDWELLVNKRGTTYRQLDDSVKASLNANNVAALLLEQPAMIKRPLLSHSGNIELGFKPDIYSELFR